MTRRAWLLAAPFSLTLVGCQSTGHLPWIDPTDYAYSRYQCYVSQVYQQTVPQLKSSLLEAMADLGYTDVACEEDGGVITVRANTVDHRPARITISPRNHMSSMTVKIGYVGDEMVSQALIQRVSMNFGELPRTIIPMEPTLQRRADPLRPRRNVPPPPAAGPPGTAIPLESEPVELPALPEGVGPFAPSDSPAVVVPPDRLGSQVPTTPASTGSH